MRMFLHRIIFLAVGTLLILFLHHDVSAYPLRQTTDTITVDMYVLFEDTGAKDGNKRCLSYPTSYGCTYYPDDSSYEYPFNANTITISMESDTTTATDNSQQGYLHNVVSQEMTEGSPLSSYTAQAIAARTYAYHQTSGGTVTIDNSAGKQVYLPYRYEGLGGSAGRKTKVHNAITLPGRLYMTVPGSYDPINAHFGQDNCTFTEDGAESYLESIYDPISAKDPGCQNSDYGTGYGGMGSAGASRWGYGNTDEYNNGTQWSVQWGEPPEVISGESWEEAYRILTHYYTDIVIRDETGQILTPGYRWNPIILDWGGGIITPPPMWYGGDGTYNVTVALQNSGHFPWTHTSQGGSAQWYLSYRWRKGSNVQEGSQRVEITQSGQPLTVSEGEYRTVTLTVTDPPDWDAGDYTLQLDMLYEVRASGNIVWFSDEQSREWFTYDIEIPAAICTQSNCNGGGTGDIYLPLIFGGEGTTLPPTNCTWEGNQLKNSAFNIGSNLDHWTVWIDQSDGFSNLNLYEGSNYYSPDSGSAGAFLGDENDNNQPSGGDNADQYITQEVLVENTEEVEAIRIAFSYCQVTYEQSSLIKDKFMVDLQAGTLGSGSAFPDIIQYINQNAFSALDSNNCKHDSGQWQRRERTVNKVSQKYSDDRLFTLIFYSDVNESRVSRFYFDTTEVNVCRR